MPQPYNYNVELFNPMNAFAAYNQGRGELRAEQQQQKSDAFAQYLPKALEGDKAALEQANANASPEQIMSLHQTLAAKSKQELLKLREENDIIGALLNGVTDETMFAQRKNIAVNQFGMPADRIASIAFADIPALVQNSKMAREAIEAQLKASEYQDRHRMANANIAQSYASADASRANAQKIRSTPVGNVDPSTGRRVATPGVQSKDYSQLQKFQETADAAASSAATLQGILKNLQGIETGDDAGAARTAAGAFSTLGNVLAPISKPVLGQKFFESADTLINNYDAIVEASKSIGIKKLQELGGSDTERELLTAIQTTVNPSVKPEENMRRFQNQLAAATILADKAALASEWVNTHGSLAYAAPNGMTWQKFWPAYQRAKWKEHHSSQNRPAVTTSRTHGVTAPAPPPGFVRTQ